MRKGITLLVMIFAMMLISTHYVHATDIEVTCKDDYSTSMTPDNTPLFDLNGFAPGDKATREILLNNESSEIPCEVYIEVTGDGNILTDMIEVIITPGYNGSLTDLMDISSILLGRLDPNESELIKMELMFLGDSDNNYAQLKASFDINIEGRWDEPSDNENDNNDSGGGDTGNSNNNDTTGDGGDVLGANTVRDRVNNIIDEIFGDNRGDETLGETSNNEMKNEEGEKDSGTVLSETDTKLCEGRSFWWIVLLIQLILTTVTIRCRYRYLRNPFVKSVLSGLFGVVGYILIREMGCGCDPSWLCRYHWIWNSLIAVFGVGIVGIVRIMTNRKDLEEIRN